MADNHPHISPPARSTYHEPPSKSCHNFCCSAFARLEGGKPVKTANLDNPILSVFKRENFPEDFDYEAFEPSFRLASHLLESDTAVVYLNTLFDGEVRTTDGKPVPWDRLLHPTEEELEIYWSLMGSVHPKPGQDTANDETRARAKQILNRMADMVDFGFITETEDEEAGGACDGLHDPLPFDANRQFPYGCRSRIQLDRTAYENLLFFTDFQELYSHLDSYNGDLLLLQRFEAVSTIVHELAHACNNAAHGFRPELYHKTSVVTEAGFELEAQIFGGIINNLHGGSFDKPWTWIFACNTSKAKMEGQNTEIDVSQENLHVVTLQEWPSHALLEDYKTNDTAMYDGHHFRNYDILWRIPLSYFESLFTTKFWSEEYSYRQGPTSLHAPKTASWLFRHVGDSVLEVKSFEVIEEELGWKRARIFCCCDQCPVEHRPDDVPQDSGEIIATTGDWFGLF